MAANVPAGVLFIDLDGTLVGPGGVNPRVWEPLAALRAKGWRLSVCTGRPGRGLALELAQRLDPQGLHVFDSGASVVRGDGAVVGGTPLTGDALAAAIAFGLDEPAIDLEIYTASGRYLVAEATETIARHEALLKVPAEVVSFPPAAHTGPFVRIQWLLPPARWAELQTQAEALPGLDLHLGRSPLMPDTYFISVLGAGVSKATGAQTVLNHYGLSFNDAAAVGDSGNDGPLLDRVGRAFAVANASPGIKARAQHIVASAADGGVAEVAPLLA